MQYIFGTILVPFRTAYLMLWSEIFRLIDLCRLLLRVLLIKTHGTYVFVVSNSECPCIVHGP